MEIDPATTVETKTLPPNKAPRPTNTSAFPATDANELNTSGDPFPNARNVTPAKEYDKLSLTHIDPSVGER